MTSTFHKPILRDAIALLQARFGAGPGPETISVPGRVNLIGEHVDYHQLPVLPMAIQRRIGIAFRSRDDGRVRAVSSGSYGDREFTLAVRLEAGPSGDWVNYLKAAAQAAQERWQLSRGIDAAIRSDLPAAAGLSSSSALLAGFALALLQANGIRPAISELMDILPEGEHFVGTRGGGMDHAAVLASEAGCALLVGFDPLEISSIPIPAEWSFLIAHSLTTAEKSGAVRAEYNARRLAGVRALNQLGFHSYRSAIEEHSLSELSAFANNGARKRLDTFETQAFLHVASEAFRVREAVAALRSGDAVVFGELLSASHTSLRDQLRVSTPELDRLVELALEAGASGARLTGAGFGGCAIILCSAACRDRVRSELVDRYYSSSAAFDPDRHLIWAEPSDGALIG